jgi:hypothetical protein
MYVPTFTYGKIPVEFWEYSALFLVLFIVLIFSGRIKRNNIKAKPQYAFFLWGLWAKIIGAIIFSIIYTSYYSGGDTTGYYECALSFYKLLLHSPDDFVTAYFGPGTPEIKSIFTPETGSPMGYMFFDEKTRMVMKLVLPFLIASFGSFFLGTVLVAVFTYGALWRLYMMFTEYFPQFSKNLAIGILFMPSVFFWGSGILKDSFTLAATCYFVVATNDLLRKRGSKVLNWVFLFLSGFIIVSIKPYILLILLPGTLVWYFYDKIRKIKNAFFRYVMVPFIYAIVASLSFVVLNGLGSKLGKFSPERALETAVITQQDLQQDYYEGSSFDIGKFEATPLSVASKFPHAVVAGLFRPFIWEARNIVMIFSGLENLFILGCTLYMLISIRRRVFMKLISENPLILYSFLFAILFAFMIGITTSNFGALVRFKIPLIPLYMGSVMIILSHLRQFKLSKESRTLRTIR